MDHLTTPPPVPPAPPASRVSRALPHTPVPNNPTYATTPDTVKKDADAQKQMQQQNFDLKMRLYYLEEKLANGKTSPNPSHMLHDNPSSPPSENDASLLNTPSSAPSQYADDHPRATPAPQSPHPSELLYLQKVR